jgi:hypothetical protein
MIPTEKDKADERTFHCVDLSEINFERVPSKGSIAEQ